MRKSTWMAQLERALSREGMTGTEKRTVLNYYEEMYQDRFDEGAAEEDIIKEFGFPEDVAQSVRENDGMSAKDGGRKSKADRYDIYDDYRENEDIPVGTHVPNYDVESHGYARSAPEYNSAPQYSAPDYGAPSTNYAPNSAPNYGPNSAPGYTPNAPNVPSAPPSEASSKSGHSSHVSIVRTVISIIAIIVLFAVGIGLAIGGAGAIVAGFASIAFSKGVWLMAFGVGLILFAIGCLLICSAVKLVQTEFKLLSGGEK